MIRWILQRRKYLFRNALLHTCTKIEVRVIIAGIRGHIEFVHLDKIEAVTFAVACTSFEKPLFHWNRNRIVAEDEELWIVYKYLIVELFLGREKEINRFFWSNCQIREYQGIISSLPILC